MKKFIIWFIVIFSACTGTEEEISIGTGEGFYSVGSADGSIVADFGAFSYRVYFPVELFDTTRVIHVSRGGTGLGDDRGQLLPYVEHFVSLGFVVIQIDHRPAEAGAVEIARMRGEEIRFVARSVADGTFDYGGFPGKVEGSEQGFLGHSAGAMEGMMVSGVAMNHGSYLVPEVTAAYLISPAGNMPDQYGITADGFNGIHETAIFVAFGEQEKDINGEGTFMAQDWRLQPYLAMNEQGPRYQAFLKGPFTNHIDVHLNNEDLLLYNRDNATAFFKYYLSNIDNPALIGQKSLPPLNTAALSRKGL